MSKIKSVYARQIIDSRGNPALEVEVATEKVCARAGVPSGASTGSHEALELRDCKKDFFGKGLKLAVSNINKIISKKISGLDCNEQEIIDELMIKLDGTSNKSKLGANAILGVSMAVCRASALERSSFLYPRIGELFQTKRFLLPIPAFNLINGGKHSGGGAEIQEYLLLPSKAKSFSEALQIGCEVYHQLKKDIENKYGKQATNVGDEGGFTPQCACFEEPLDLILDAVDEIGYAKKIVLGIDCAATTFYRHGKYYLEGEEYSSSELIDKYIELAQNYPLSSIEDPFFEEDFKSFCELTEKIGKKVQIVGDDITVTNYQRIQKAVVQNSCNCLLLKINQIGTITEALNSTRLALDNKWKVMVSHRSGETEDTFISDLAVGISAGQIKAGAPCRGERVAKYNQLLRIEESLGKKAKYGGIK